MPPAEPVPEITPEERVELRGRWSEKPTWCQIGQSAVAGVLLLLLAVPLSLGLGILAAVGMRVLEGACLVAFLLSGARWLWRRFKRH
jgi:hypothetical protein